MSAIDEARDPPPFANRGTWSVRTDLSAEQPTLPPAPADPSVAAPPVPTTLNDHHRINVAGYEVEGELGRGGMGVVYKARQVGLNRIVALQMILNGQHAEQDLLARFRAEAQAIASLQHPHIVQVYEVGVQDGLPYFSLEYVDGGSLDRRLADKPPSPQEAASLARTLALAVHAVHQKGIIHRDLKPANILLTADGTPKITDFGLAKSVADDRGRTASGAVLGTPSYMAPEQAGGRRQEVGAAADIYALGAILYEMLTGRPPFQADTPLDTLLLLVTEAVTPPRELAPRVPRPIEAICLKCLEKEPGRRYATAGALADDLRRFLAGESVRARPMTAGERVLRWAARRPGTFLLLALTAALLAAASALTFAAPVPVLGIAVLAPCVTVLLFLLPGVRGVVTASGFALLFCSVVAYEFRAHPHYQVPLLVGAAGTALGSAAARGLARAVGGHPTTTVLAGFWSGLVGFGLCAALLMTASLDPLLVLVGSGGGFLLVFVLVALYAAQTTGRRVQAS